MPAAALALGPPAAPRQRRAEPARAPQVLPYDTLAAALDEPLPPGASVRALEDFLINECFGTVRSPPKHALITP